MWVAVITQMGLFPFVNTLGAILAPVFGIMIVDYYIIKKERLDVNALFDASPKAKYHYNSGFNHKAIIAWVLSGYIAVGTVYPNKLCTSFAHTLKISNHPQFFLFDGVGAKSAL